MKKLICLALSILLIFSCTACGGFQKIDLQDTIPIPEDGMIAKKTMQQLKNENAIGTFSGQSNGFAYEWTVFGSDVEEPADMNFLVDVVKAGDEVILTLASGQPFGYSALLSVNMDDLWEAQTATAYDGSQAISSVSLTGTKQTILNLSLDGSVRKLRVRPDELPVDADPVENAEVSMEAEVEAPTSQQSAPVADDSYLSGVTDTNDIAYSQGTSQPTGSSQSNKTEEPTKNDNVDDSYTSSSASSSSDRVYSDGSQSGKDQYQTDPIPVGKPMPVEPEDQTVDTSKKYTCTFSIECSTILNNLDQLDPDKLEMVPSGGTILSATTVTFSEGESVFDVLQRICREKGIHLESSWTPIYNSAYIEGIHNLYEFDCGSLSGWMYRVNGWYPNYGCSRYQLQDGDRVEWRFTCDLGNDIGGGNVFS